VNRRLSYKHERRGTQCFPSGGVQGWRACVHTPSRAAPPVGRHRLNTARQLHLLDLRSAACRCGQATRTQHRRAYTLLGQSDLMHGHFPGASRYTTTRGFDVRADMVGEVLQVEGFSDVQVEAH